MECGVEVVVVFKVVGCRVDWLVICLVRMSFVRMVGVFMVVVIVII